VDEARCNLATRFDQVASFGEPEEKMSVWTLVAKLRSKLGERRCMRDGRGPGYHVSEVKPELGLGHAFRQTLV
jgi:hypothetical protein